VEDAIARKAEADGLIGFVDDELIADIEDIPPGICLVRAPKGRRRREK
jgi:hypothetical protein